MFRPKQDSEPTRIRLPRRNIQPAKDYLQFAILQALQYRDKEVEISWTDNKTSKLFSLIVKTERNQNDPSWILCEENESGPQLIWSGETSDLDIIQDQLSLLNPPQTASSRFSVNSQPAEHPAPPENPYRNPSFGSHQNLRPPTGGSLRESFTKLPQAHSREQTTSNARLQPIGSSQSFSWEQPAVSKPTLPATPDTNSFQSTAQKFPGDEQLEHLEKAGLKPKALLVKRQENLGDNELRLLLSKNSDTDPSAYIAIYKNLPKKFTVDQLCQLGAIDKSAWVPVVFNFFTNGLIDIKPPLITDGSALDFVEDGKAVIKNIETGLLRQETGILSYPALLYFLQYEYLRFQLHDCPLSLIVFEMGKENNSSLGGTDLINTQETLVALRLLNTAKRPLDLLGHFEAINYAVLMPNTTGIVANQVAKDMIKELTAERLSADLDPKFLKLSFGIASIPSDCDNITALVTLAKKALQEAKSGDYIIVQAESVK